MQNNPAARLYDLARRLRSTSGDGPAASLWAQVFDIPLNHETTGPRVVQVTKRILAFLDLLEETQAGLTELQFDDFYSEVFPPLRRVAETSLSNLMASHSESTGPITDETLTLLRVIAAEWSKKSPDPKIDEDVLREIVSEVHRLFELVKREEIDPKLKRLILSLTSEIEQAIQHYRIHGPEALEHAQAIILGRIQMNLNLINKAKTQQRVLWSRFYNVCTKFFEVLRLANETRKTIESVSPLVRLLGAPDEIPRVDLDDSGK